MKTFRNIVHRRPDGSAATFGIAQNGASEKAKSPAHRRRPIASIDDAIAYMEAAPHDFGGHKARQPSRFSKAAVRDLKLALAYRR